MNKIKYHFFGTECLIDRALSDSSDLENHLRKLDFNYQYQPLFAKQIHSDKVVVIDDIDKIYNPHSRPQGDALVTNVKNIVLAIITADCVPLLLFDEDNSVVAAAHSGWKGAKKGIIANTIAQMVKIGAKRQNIICQIGAAIRQESYEVGEEFYQDFIVEDKNNSQFFITSKQKGHFMFNLPAYVKNKLQNENIAKILDEEIDTYSNPETLFSYRRSCHLDQKDCGRNVSVITIDN